MPENTEKSSVNKDESQTPHRPDAHRSQHFHDQRYSGAIPDSIDAPPIGGGAPLA